eukprot:scaffold229559_cov92-Attheya_sp.AAC.2
MAAVVVAVVVDVIDCCGCGERKYRDYPNSQPIQPPMMVHSPLVPRDGAHEIIIQRAAQHPSVSSQFVPDDDGRLLTALTDVGYIGYSISSDRTPFLPCLWHILTDKRRSAGRPRARARTQSSCLA